MIDKISLEVDNVNKLTFVAPVELLIMIAAKSIIKVRMRSTQHPILFNHFTSFLRSRLHLIKMRKNNP